MNNKFSIIVRIYNAEKYLTQCIESVINQTYKNWELILVNDGSTDNSLDICNLYANKDKRIKIVNQENQGGVAAQISGFENITGDLVCGLDSDDWYEPLLFEKVNEYFYNKDIDLLLFGYKCINSDNTTTNFVLTDKSKLLIKNEVVDFVMNTTAHALWLKVFKRELIKYTDYEKEIIKKNGKKFKFNNDVFLCIPLLFNSQKSLIVPDLLYNYRIIQNSSSHKKNPFKRINVSLDTMDYLYKIFTEKKYVTDEKLYLIDNEIYREIIPEIYQIIRHFQIKFKEIRNIKNKQIYKYFIKSPNRKKILANENIKHRIALFIFRIIL